jgi:spore maturation protein CgeB
MRIDFLIVDNDYGTSSHFSEQLALALQRKGVETRLFYISGGNFYKAFYQIQSDPPDLTCSFSDITIGKNAPLGEAWGICHLSFFIDHAAYFLHQLSPTYSMVGAIDQEDVVFLEQLGFSRAFFFPHGVERELSFGPDLPSYEVSYLGTCIDIEEIEKSWKMKFSQKIRALLDECAYLVLHEGISPLRALLERGVEENLPLLHQELENYVRGKDRLGLLAAIKDQPLHIWGKGKWKKYLPEAKVHRSIPFSSAIDIMRKSKILLNSVPTLQHSSHERLFSAPLVGCLPLTSDTTYARKEFVEGRSMATYRHGSWDAVREKVHFYLNNEEKRKEVVKSAGALILEKHTWDSRADILLDRIPILLVQ